MVFFFSVHIVYFVIAPLVEKCRRSEKRKKNRASAADSRGISVDPPDVSSRHRLESSSIGNAETSPQEFIHSTRTTDFDHRSDFNSTWWCHPRDSAAVARGTAVPDKAGIGGDCLTVSASGSGYIALEKVFSRNEYRVSSSMLEWSTRENRCFSNSMRPT